MQNDFKEFCFWIYLLKVNTFKKHESYNPGYKNANEAIYFLNDVFTNFF